MHTFMTTATVKMPKGTITQSYIAAGWRLSCSRRTVTALCASRGEPPAAPTGKTHELCAPPVAQVRVIPVRKVYSALTSGDGALDGTPLRSPRYSQLGGNHPDGGAGLVDTKRHRD